MNIKRPSIQDVARIAGVSTATVSRTLSNPKAVVEAKRAAVLQAIRSTGYRMNVAAQNLRRRRTNSVLALVPNLANPFFSKILSGVSNVLAPAGYNLIISDSHANGNLVVKEQLMSYLDRGGADGLILFDGAISLEYLDNEKRDHPLPPTVLACEWIEGSQLPRVRIDNENGAIIAIEHLYGLGHRKIGFIKGPAGNVLSISREIGMRRALAQHDLKIQPDWIFCGDFSFESGVSAAKRWLGLNNKPTAVFCVSDEMAIGFIGALQRAGKNVPKDVSVMGFDQIELAGYSNPSLTTISQPRTEIGSVAAQTLLALINNETIENTDRLLPVELIKGASTDIPVVTFY